MARLCLRNPKHLWIQEEGKLWKLESKIKYQQEKAIEATFRKTSRALLKDWQNASQRSLSKHPCPEV